MWAGSLLGFVCLRLALQVIRQWTPCRSSVLASGSGRLGATVARRSSTLGLCRFQILEPQFELFDLMVELLALASELHPPQFQDEQFQILDFGLPRNQRFVL